jgi:hypothetical protein
MRLDPAAPRLTPNMRCRRRTSVPSPPHRFGLFCVSLMPLPGCFSAVCPEPCPPPIQTLGAKRSVLLFLDFPSSFCFVSFVTAPLWPANCSLVHAWCSWCYKHTPHGLVQSKSSALSLSHPLCVVWLITHFLQPHTLYVCSFVAQHLQVSELRASHAVLLVVL